MPSANVVDEALHTIQDEVTQADEVGEVLFIAQRQLLTFGQIIDVDLVPEFEKKYMMDQAMAGNELYFDDLYRDLENERFVLIVSDPLNVNLKNESEGFGAENNSWVKFVSEPILCYYKPYITLREVGVQLLVPKDGPVDGNDCVSE